MFFVVFGFMVIGIKSCSDFIVLVFKMFVYICEVDFMFVSLFSYNDMYVESILVILDCISYQCYYFSLFNKLKLL